MSDECAEAQDRIKDLESKLSEVKNALEVQKQLAEQRGHSLMAATDQISQAREEIAKFQIREGELLTENDAMAFKINMDQAKLSKLERVRVAAEALTKCGEGVWPDGCCEGDHLGAVQEALAALRETEER